MIAIIQPSKISRIISTHRLPKVRCRRACAAALLTKGTSIIRNPGHANDDKAATGNYQETGS